MEINMRNRDLEKLSITNIGKISEKYGVTIEMKFGNNPRTIIENSDEINTIQQGFDVNLVDAILQMCKEMKLRKDKKIEEIDKRLANLDPKIFPNNLTNL